MIRVETDENYKMQLSLYTILGLIFSMHLWRHSPENSEVECYMYTFIELPF